MGITVGEQTYSVWGNRSAIVSSISMGSSYPTGGEPLNLATNFGIHAEDIVLIESDGGYSFKWDATNHKVKAFSAAPPVVYDERRVLDSNYQCQTRYPAAFFMNVASVGQNLKLRSTGIAQTSLTAGECCLASQMAAGARTTLTVSPVNQITNGAIGDGTGWTAGTDWAAASNAAHKASSTATATYAHDTFAAIVGHTYRTIYTVSDWASGAVAIGLGGVAGTARSADGTYTEDIVALTTGALAFTPSGTSHLTIDTVYIYDLDVYATYATQAWKAVWENLVQDETKTLATGANTLTSGNKILACMYIDQTTATAAALTMVDEDDTAASGEVEIAFNAATAQFTVHSDQNAKAVKTTYIKRPSSGFLNDRAFHNEGAAKTGANPYLNTYDYPIILWGYAGCMPVNGGATLYMIDFPSTPATGECILDYFNPGTRGAGAPASGSVVGILDNVTGTGAGVWGSLDELQRHPLEVPEGVDLSGVTCKLLVVGV
jgi:hypothetical protein